MFFSKTKVEIINRNYENANGGDFVAPTPSDIASKANHEVVRNITALFSSIILSSIGYGILMVMIAFKLEEFVKNEVLISVSSAMQIIAGIVFSRFLPQLGNRFGTTNSIYIGSAISAVSALLMHFYAGYFLWLLITFTFGVSAFICGVTRQTVMINLAPPHIRSVIISCGSMLVALGNSFGPVFLELLQTGNSFLTFLIASGFYVASIIPLSRLKKVEVSIREEKKIGIWRYIKNSPKIMFAGFCVSYSMSSAGSFLIIYGIKVGMTPSDASLLLSVLLFGSIFSIPFGYLADLLNRRFMMISCAVLSLFCIVTLYNNSDPQRMYVLVFLMFGCMIGMKLPAVVLINEKYKATQRLAVNSAFSKFSLIGNIFGIFCTGAIMKSFGPKGLWISVMIILALFLLFCCYNYLTKFLKKELDFSDFSILNTNKIVNE